MIEFKNLLMLAPLAGYTDLPFRSMVKKFGVDLSVSEMISSHALVYSNAKTLKMIEKASEETPFSVQISGSKIDIIKKAIEILNAKQGIDVIDLNCGCPAPKVANHGNGSGLLKDLNLLVKIANLIKQDSKTPYTSLKLRLGFDKKITNEIAQALKDVQSDFVVVHGRTRADGYKKDRIDYDSIAYIKQNVPMPIIANGEIDSVAKAKWVLNHTGANGIMIGRAAISSPWIFWQIKNDTEQIPPIIKKELVLEHFNKMISFYGNRGAIMFRKNLHACAKGHSGASEFRATINTLSDVEMIKEHIERFFSTSNLVENAFPQIIHLNKRTS